MFTIYYDIVHLSVTQFLSRALLSMMKVALSNKLQMREVLRKTNVTAVLVENDYNTVQDELYYLSINQKATLSATSSSDISGTSENGWGEGAQPWTA